MSINTYVVKEVLCDHPDCFDSVEIVKASGYEVRTAARKDGWRCDKTGDWCQAHANPPSLSELVERLSM